MSDPRRPNERQSYHVVFTTYASWLHGDKRGSKLFGGAYLPPDPDMERRVRQRCNYDEVRLSLEQRRIVFKGIRAEAQFHEWTIHALNVLDNHVHLLISAPCEINPSSVLARIKSGATSALHKAGFFLNQKAVWTSGGSVAPIRNSGHFWKTRNYILHKQKWLPFEMDD
ncbi:MAG: transposase [Thermoguttaceae bacterium]|nr:transposase [Thermoguttaceae bacterium]